MAVCDASQKQKTNTVVSVAMAVPQNFFVYVEPAVTQDNSLYRCLKCPTGDGKNISCHNKSRQNMREHIMVSLRQPMYVGLLYTYIYILHAQGYS